MRVLGLPGNPVSTFVCAELFLKPLIRAMLGLPTAPDIVDRKARRADAGERRPRGLCPRQADRRDGELDRDALPGAGFLDARRRSPPPTR